MERITELGTGTSRGSGMEMVSWGIGTGCGIVRELGAPEYVVRTGGGISTRMEELRIGTSKGVVRGWLSSGTV